MSPEEEAEFQTSEFTIGISETGCSTIFDALSDIAPDLRRAGDEAIIVYTADDPESLRNRLSHLVTDDEGLLVAEFEKWFGYGKALDSVWLLARGH